MSGSGISWAICKCATRSRQITTPALHYSSFLQAGCPSCRPANSVKALKAYYVGSGTFFIHEVHRLNALFVLDRFILYVQQVCEVDSAAVAEKLASSSADISALDAEHASSWSPASGCSDAAEDSVLQQATQAKVEAVTLMLTVQPGNHVTTSTCSYIACSFVLGRGVCIGCSRIKVRQTVLLFLPGPNP